MRLLLATLRNGTVPFVFVAGFLFQHLSNRFRYQPYLKSKLKYVVLPYLIVSLPAIAHQYMSRSGIYELPTRPDVLHAVARAFIACLTGAQMPVPFWFVPMIALFYVGAPLFMAIDKHPVWYWILPPAFVIAPLIHRSLGHKNVFHSALYFFPVYLLGLWSSHFRRPLFAWLRMHRWILGGLVVALLAIEVAVLHLDGPIFSLRPFSAERGVLDLDLFAKVLGSLLLIDFLQARRAATPAWLSAVANASFGIFFVHQYVIQFVVKVSLWLPVDLKRSGLAAAVILTLVVTSASFLAVSLVRRIFGKHSRIIVGS